jgi:Ca2+-binding EF-hand superfamily protein
MSYRPMRAILFNALLALPLVAIAPIERATAGSSIIYDTDQDGTLDLAEVKTAARTAFSQLDNNSDGKLDAKELHGRMRAKEIAEADTDHDGTISKDEYLALVEKLFNEADADQEGTLSQKELRSKPGRALLRLLQ